jgi:hypothetical protein
MGPRALADLLPSELLNRIKTERLPTGATHPAYDPLYREPIKPLDALIDQSIHHIRHQGDADWLPPAAERISDFANVEDAAAALAELRAYGALLEASFDVRPVPRAKTPTPDFIVSDGTNEIVVEVFTKHEDAAQTRLRADLHAGVDRPEIHRSTTDLPGGRIDTAITVLQPGGAPVSGKPGDGVQANVISRICGAKGTGHQNTGDRPFVLWLDLTRFGQMDIGPDQLTPLISGRDGLTSGAIWYAYHGWRGAPIFEEDFEFHERIVRMGHEGRFRADERLSGVVIALADKTVLFENPWTKRPFADRARRLFERLPHFDLALSIADWRPGMALRRVDDGAAMIEAMLEWHAHFDAD